MHVRDFRGFVFFAATSLAAVPHAAAPLWSAHLFHYEASRISMACEYAIEAYSARADALPHALDEALDAARRLVGGGHVILDPAARTIGFDEPGVELDLGGIAKGYAVDRAVLVLKRRQVAPKNHSRPAASRARTSWARARACRRRGC